ncbi:MAG: hypothetical protein E6G39_03540 [Actinobacteria bacterium]|nr:MAG: hypothetical protein E6G39_03540 [Actinomycetota bacterium]
MADIDRARPRRVKENVMNKPHGAGRWRRISLSLGVCIALVLTLSGCSSNGKELSTLNPKGRYSRSIDNLFTPVGYIAIAVFVFVLGAVLYMWFRFRVREHVEGEWPVQNHGNTKLEITWTIVPLLILAIIAVPSLATLQKLNSKANQNDMTVVVVGQPQGRQARRQAARCHHRHPARHPHGQRRASRGHLTRRHPFVLDPCAQRQARRGARSFPAVEDRSRQPWGVFRPMHRVLRVIARAHANADGCGDAVRLHAVGRRPASAVRAGERVRASVVGPAKGDRRRHETGGGYGARRSHDHVGRR